MYSRRGEGGGGGDEEARLAFDVFSSARPKCSTYLLTFKVSRYCLFILSILTASDIAANTFIDLLQLHLTILLVF